VQIIRLGDEPAGSRRDPEHVEVTTGNDLANYLLGPASAGHIHVG